MITIEEAQEISGIGYWELDYVNDQLIWSNQVYKIFQVDPKEFTPSYENFLNIIHPDDREKVDEAYSTSVETKTPYHIQHRIVLKDNSVRYVIEKGETFFNEEGAVIKSIGSIQDITESEIARMKLEASQHKFMAISNQTTEGITVADLEGNYVFVNPAFCEMSGYSEEELLQLTVFDMKAPNQDHSSFKNSKEDMEGKPIRVILQKKDGTEYYTEIIGDVIHVDDESLVLGTIRDITERVRNEEKINELNRELEVRVEERTNELNRTVQQLSKEVEQRKEIEAKLKDSLQVKELLFREITHRVKNNMQIISSLINLQKNQLDKDSCEFLEQISLRIHSMALIHETLYKTNEFEQIQFDHYLKSLLKYIRESYKSSIVSFRLKTDNSTLPLDIGTSCGMIIIELVTNAIKHAFSDKHPGTIEIQFEQLAKNNFLLSISDDGHGIPNDLDFRNTQSLGLQLVNNLVDQIGGTIQLVRDSGTKFEIQFKTQS